MVCVWLILNELQFNHKPSPDLSRLTEHLKRQLQAASMNTQTIVLAILAMCIASGSSAPRERRRAKPRTDQPIDLMELRRQCIHHGWSECSDEADKLRDPNSHFNIQYQECHEQATKQILDKVIVDITSNSSTVPEQCPRVVAKQRSTAREVYCSYFKEIATLASDSISGHTLVTMKELIPCVQWKPDEGELTPDDIVGMLELWIEEKVKRRNGSCCGLMEVPKRFEPKDRELASVPINCHRPVSYVRFNAMQWWQEKLARLVELMKAVELLENLGRNKKCLRGCFNLAQVKCVENQLL